MKRLVRNPYPPTDLSVFCRLWKKHRDATGRPLCVAFQEKNWKNRYRTVQAAIACGDLDWILTKMVEEKWNDKNRKLVLVAWYDYHFANAPALPPQRSGGRQSRLLASLEVAVSKTPRTDAIAKRFEGRDTKSITYHDVKAIVALSRSLEEELNTAMRLNKAMWG